MLCCTALRSFAAVLSCSVGWHRISPVDARLLPNNISPATAVQLFACASCVICCLRFLSISCHAPKVFEGLPEGFSEDQDTVVRYMKLLPPVFSDEDRRAEAAAVRVFLVPSCAPLVFAAFLALLLPISDLHQKSWTRNCVWAASSC